MITALDIALAFVAVGKADTDFVGSDPLNPTLRLAAGQTNEEFTAPCVVFQCQTAQPLDALGNVLPFTLALHVQSSANGTTDADHAARVAAVVTKYFADAGTIAAVEDAILDQGKMLIVPHYSAGPSDPTLAQSRFETPLVISGIAIAV